MFTNIHGAGKQSATYCTETWDTLYIIVHIELITSVVFKPQKSSHSTPIHEQVIFHLQICSDIKFPHHDWTTLALEMYKIT